MELSLYVVKEHLEKEFSLGCEHLVEDRLFRRMTCYLGEDTADLRSGISIGPGPREPAGTARCPFQRPAAAGPAAGLGEPAAGPAGPGPGHAGVPAGRL